jgi:uncharacterized membrane protein (UPF0127 family)
MIKESKHKPKMKVSNLTRRTLLASSVEVASSSRERRKGLLGRDNLASREGLWIVPCESIHTFFMKFSIDLVYLDRSMRVKKVRSDVPPWRLSACLTAYSVIELAAGSIKTSQTSPGDQLEFVAVET